MNGMVQWFSQYWQYALGLAASTAVLAVVLRMAVRSYKAYYKRYRDEEAEIKRLVKLKEEYGELTKQAIESGSSEELLQGVALSYQLKLQKKEDMTAEFEKMEKPKQYIYALDVFISDKTLRTFFKENGKELTDIIVPALEMIGLDEEAKTTEQIRLMHDEKDESVSFDESRIEKAQEYFDRNGFLTKIKLQGAEYIRKNAEIFI